jgi:hypothetical protein
MLNGLEIAAIKQIAETYFPGQSLLESALSARVSRRGNDAGYFAELGYLESSGNGRTREFHVLFSTEHRKSRDGRACVYGLIVLCTAARVTDIELYTLECKAPETFDSYAILHVEER